MYESSCSYQTALDLKRPQVKSEDCLGVPQCSPDWASYRFHQSTFEQLKQSVEKAKAALQDRSFLGSTGAFSDIYASPRLAESLETVVSLGNAAGCNVVGVINGHRNDLISSSTTTASSTSMVDTDVSELSKIRLAAVTTVPIDTSLNTFIRQHANLRGTKFMCFRGRLRIYSCNGMEVITVEALGNRRDSYHPIQSRLATHNGTQCGFCNPGWVMSMFALLEADRGELTMETVENAFGGNLCRCTGYRPILDAFKSIASDATDRLRDETRDIEDLPTFCPKMPHKKPFDRYEEKCHFFKCSSGREWHKA
ncbi:2Fe-2S ferredoxin-type domain-containing protein [Sergentomyia squamirostris]